MKRKTAIVLVAGVLTLGGLAALPVVLLDISPVVLLDRLSSGWFDSKKQAPSETASGMTAEEKGNSLSGVFDQLSGMLSLGGPDGEAGSGQDAASGEHGSQGEAGDGIHGAHGEGAAGAHGGDLAALRDGAAPEGGDAGDADGHDAADHDGEGGEGKAAGTTGTGDHPAHKFDVQWQEKLPRGEGQPWRAFREIQHAQDRLVAGDSATIASYRNLLGRLAMDMRQRPVTDWDVKRNRFAAAGMVLSGVSPAFARDILLRAGSDDEAAGLLAAALALAEGDRFAAYTGFDRFEPSDLPPSLAGQIALTKAMTQYPGSENRMVQLLEQARLLAPSTLVEEAALRRILRIQLEKGDRTAFATTARIYLRKFPRSAYVNEFLGTLASGLNRLSTEDSVMKLADFDPALERVPAEGLIYLYTLVSRSAIAFGFTGLSTEALERLQKLTGQSDERLRLYRVASSVEDPDFMQQVRDMTDEMDAIGLTPLDRRLWGAVRLISEEIGRPLDDGPAYLLPEDGQEGDQAAPAGAAEPSADPIDPEFAPGIRRARNLLNQSEDALKW